MRKSCLVAIVFSSLISVRHAAADGEITAVIGASTGGDIDVLGEEEFDLETAFRDSPLFGLRIGSYGFPFGVEGSLVYSPATLSGGALDETVEASTNVLYAEANLLLIILPGPVAPFVTGGIGVHYLDFDFTSLVSFDRTKLGYNLGGGLKVSVARLTLRLDVRDHVTTFGLDEGALGLFGGLIGLSDSDARIHNVEVSFGVGIRF